MHVCLHMMNGLPYRVNHAQPLHYAVMAARVEVIKYLVQALNVPITVTAEVNH